MEIRTWTESVDNSQKRHRKGEMLCGQRQV